MPFANHFAVKFVAPVAAVLALGAVATSAHAGGDVSWSITLSSPVPVYYEAAPVVVPQPVYVQPAPVYYQSAPVYVRPVVQYRPVYLQPAPVYVPPRVRYQQQWYGGHPGYGHGHGHGYPGGRVVLRVGG